MLSRIVLFSEGVRVLPNIDLKIFSGMKSQPEGFSAFCWLSFLDDRKFLVYTLFSTINLGVLGVSVCLLCPSREFPILCILYLSSDLS